MLKVKISTSEVLETKFNDAKASGLTFIQGFFCIRPPQRLLADNLIAFKFPPYNFHLIF
jgi:hypothetical protein